MADRLELRYGCNPHQKSAQISVASGDLPLSVLGGAPGYINLMDALNSWQLVRELRLATGLAAATSFKHVSPAGTAVATPMSEALKESCRVADMELSPVAVAYARARGADRVSSFGDFVAVSNTVDLSLAQLLKREVSDGIIAPDYDDHALEMLRSKRGGKYLILKVDPDYEPPESETREIFGITLEQTRNSLKMNNSHLENVVTSKNEMRESAVRDLLVATITLKYTQSNSIALAYDGQCIGIGAGQQSRIHCVRLACHKADLWFLRQHPTVLGLPFKPKTKRPDKDNTTDQFLNDDVTPKEMEGWKNLLTEVPEKLSAEEKKKWLVQFPGASLSSDAFIPFRDSIDRANESGVQYVVQAGGSIRDDLVIEACNEYGMTMATSGIRLFHH